MQRPIFKKWIYFNKIRALSWFRARNIPIRSDFWALNSLIRSYFERTTVWTIVWVWCGPWLHNRLDNGLIVVWSEVLSVWKIWSETVLSALRAHTVFRAHFCLIRGYFGLWCSDQRLLLSGTVWLGGHFRMAPQPGWWRWWWLAVFDVIIFLPVPVFR